MLIRKSTHDAIVAAKDATAEGLMDRLNHAEDLNRRYVAEVRDLRAKLARYTAPRKRGERGRFLPLDAQVQA